MLAELPGIIVDLLAGLAIIAVLALVFGWGGAS